LFLCASFSFRRNNRKGEIFVWRRFSTFLGQAIPTMLTQAFQRCGPSLSASFLFSFGGNRCQFEAVYCWSQPEVKRKVFGHSLTLCSSVYSWAVDVTTLVSGKFLGEVALAAQSASFYIVYVMNVIM
jgi:hypothetical protein